MSVRLYSFVFHVRTSLLPHFHNVVCTDNVRRRTSIRHWLTCSMSYWIVVPVAGRDWLIPRSRFWKLRLYWSFCLLWIAAWVSVYSICLLTRRSGRVGRCYRFVRCLEKGGLRCRARNARYLFVRFGSRSGWFRHNRQRYVGLPGFVWILFSVRRYLRNLLRSLRQSVSPRRRLAGRAGFSGRLWRRLAGERLSVLRGSDRYLILLFRE